MKKAEERLALSSSRVLDLTDESGVFCTKILAALGADVIKIEPPGGDSTRRIGPFYHDEPDLEKSLHWFTYNLNKRSITLNIECITGHELFKRLVKTADFIVECFRPGYLDKIGLDYSDLSSINPRLIHTSITPYGSKGPYSQFKGSNLIISAASGFLWICGDEDRPPVQVATPVAYVQTGLEAAAATMVADWYREQTGRGQHVDVSAQESMMHQVAIMHHHWKSRHVIPQRSKWGMTRPGRASIARISRCKDGYVHSASGFAQVGQGRQPLREWLASEGLAYDLFDRRWDPVFLEGVTITKEQKQHIDALFDALASRHSADELMEEAQKRGIQITKVSDVRDVVENPHSKHRGYFVKVEHPELGEAITYTGAPFKSEEMDWSYWLRAPLIGEHNKEIYQGELDLNDRELAILKEGGVI